MNLPSDSNLFQPLDFNPSVPLLFSAPSAVCAGQPRHPDLLSFLRLCHAFGFGFYCLFACDLWDCLIGRLGRAAGLRIADSLLIRLIRFIFGWCLGLVLFVHFVGYLAGLFDCSFLLLFFGWCPHLVKGRCLVRGFILFGKLVFYIGYRLCLILNTGFRLFILLLGRIHQCHEYLKSSFLELKFALLIKQCLKEVKCFYSFKVN